MKTVNPFRDNWNPKKEKIFIHKNTISFCYYTNYYYIIYKVYNICIYRYIYEYINI